MKQIKMTLSEEATQKFLELGKELFSDCWKLLKSASTAEFDDPYWEWAIDQQRQIDHLHGSDLTTGMVIAILDQIEWESKRSYSHPEDYEKGGCVNGAFNDFWKVYKKYFGTAGQLSWSYLVCDLSEYRRKYRSDLATWFANALEDELAEMCRYALEEKKKEEESSVERSA